MSNTRKGIKEFTFCLNERLILLNPNKKRLNSGIVPKPNDAITKALPPILPVVMAAATAR